MSVLNGEFAASSAGGWLVDWSVSRGLKCHLSSGWWQLKYVLFSPRKLGEMIQFDEHIFQMG